MESCPIPGNSCGVHGVAPRTPGEAEVENSPVSELRGQEGNVSEEENSKQPASEQSSRGGYAPLFTLKPLVAMYGVQFG